MPDEADVPGQVLLIQGPGGAESSDADNVTIRAIWLALLKAQVADSKRTVAHTNQNSPIPHPEVRTCDLCGPPAPVRYFCPNASRHA